MKPSKSMAFGCLVEALIIGEDIGEMFYINCPASEKAQYAENKIHKANGLTEITQEQLNKATLTIEGMKYDERGLLLESLMSEAKHGVVVRFEDELTGLPIQVRYDTIFPNVGIVDWKTTKDHPSKFSKSAYDYGYNLQQYIYQGAWHKATGEELGFYFPVFQNCYPFEFDFIELPRELIEDAKACYTTSIKGIKEMLDFGGMPIRKGHEASIPEIPAYISWKFKGTGTEAENGA